MKNRGLLRLGIVASAVLCVSAWPAGADEKRPTKDDLVDQALRKQLVDYLVDLDTWIMTLDVGSGTLKNTKDTRTSVFINGNLARVLMASHKITGNRAYLDEALRWCDNLCDKQQITETSTGKQAGFWPDCSPKGNIYFGDAGTAATALAIGYRFADEKRKARYLAAMKRKFRFVTEGCRKDPQGGRRKATRTWVISKGKDRGALGCGYYRGKLSVEPYTISTATTGVAFFSELYALTNDARCREIASGGARWLLKIRKPDGEIPYTLAGNTLTRWPLDTLAYCIEGFVAADKRLGDAELSKLMRTGLEPTVRWFLARQNADGSWGKLRSADQQRSPRAVTLLTWYYRQVKRDPKVADSVRGYCRFLLDPEHSKAYGVKSLLRTSGFVGLTVADIIAPGSTF